MFSKSFRNFSKMFLGIKIFFQKNSFSKIFENGSEIIHKYTLFKTFSQKFSIFFSKKVPEKLQKTFKSFLNKFKKNLKKVFVAKLFFKKNQNVSKIL